MIIICTTDFLTYPYQAYQYHFEVVSTVVHIRRQDVNLSILFRCCWCCCCWTHKWTYLHIRYINLLGIGCQDSSLLIFRVCVGLQQSEPEHVHNSCYHLSISRNPVHMLFELAITLKCLTTTTTLHVVFRSTLCSPTHLITRSKLRTYNIESRAGARAHIQLSHFYNDRILSTHIKYASCQWGN